MNFRADFSVWMVAFFLVSPSYTVAQFSQLNLLRQMPSNILRELKGGSPDERGLIGINRQQGYMGAEYQRGGMDTLLAGVTLHRRDWIEEGLRVAEVTFSRQLADGSFGDRVATGAAFWITPPHLLSSF